jgi:hypothetical protein
MTSVLAAVLTETEPFLPHAVSRADRFARAAGCIRHQECCFLPRLRPLSVSAIPWSIDRRPDPGYNSTMKIKLISCEALAREFYAAAASSPHVIDTQLLAFGLHNTPDDLRATIQAAVDAANPDTRHPTPDTTYDAIILGYGLCSRGTAGIRARSIPIVIPRMHDCITALLGSRARYLSEFVAHPGTYYYSPGWIERKEGDVDQGFIDVHAKSDAERYAEYVARYGQDNAEFLVEQEQKWQTHYTRAALIDMGIGAIDQYRRFTAELARDRGWEYAELVGDMSLINRLTNADWESDDFLIVQPGQSIAESFDDLILKSDPPASPIC